MRDLTDQDLKTPQGADAPNLRLENVTVRLGGRPVLDWLDLSLDGPGLTVILGPNGAGKSQLLKVMHGLTEPEEGHVTWNGRPARQATREQALVFQKPVLLRRSVAANIDFVLKARGLDRAKCATLLKHVGLLDKARQPARALSGGEAQRLALARALALDPKVLFLDEPTASLDPGSVLAIERIIQGAHDRGVKVILITHDIGQARRLADEVVFLHRGRVAEQASAHHFFATQGSAAARDFLQHRIVV